MVGGAGRVAEGFGETAEVADGDTVQKKPNGLRVAVHIGHVGDKIIRRVRGGHTGVLHGGGSPLGVESVQRGGGGADAEDGPTWQIPRGGKGQHVRGGGVAGDRGASLRAADISRARGGGGDGNKAGGASQKGGAVLGRGVGVQSAQTEAIAAEGCGEALCGLTVSGGVCEGNVGLHGTPFAAERGSRRFVGRYRGRGVVAVTTVGVAVNRGLDGAATR